MDQQLLRLLGQDARQNSETLGNQLKVSAATVRRKIIKLIQSDVLRIIGVVDPDKVDLPVTVLIGLDVAPKKLESAMKLLGSRPEITWVSTTTGRFDIIAKGWFASTSDLSKFMTIELADIKGLKDSETFICLNVMKGYHRPFP